MEDGFAMSDRKKFFTRVVVIGIVVAVIIGAGLTLLKKSEPVSPISPDEGESVRVIFISPKPSESIIASPSATPKTSPKATPKSSPKTSPTATASASPKE